MVALSMVLGGGFWSPEEDRQPAAMPGGTDNIRQVTTSPVPHPVSEQQGARASTQGMVASASDNLFRGYVSTSTLSVTPQQLGVETHVVEDGQTISSVATETGRSEETLLWANDYHDPDEPLSEGTQLRIPPIDGMLHVISEGDTLESIADRYEVTRDAITSYAANGIERSSDLVPDRLIMVPGGAMPMRSEVVSYIVREGDQLRLIADRFGLRPQTIIWTNDLEYSNDVEPGLELTILPTDGVLVDVDAEDTVETLAENFGVRPAAIREWPENEVGSDGSLLSGQSIMIPGGRPSGSGEPVLVEFAGHVDIDEPVDIDAVWTEVNDDDEQEEPDEPPEPSPEGTGEFVWPTTGVITQYFHASHNGWDIANRPGTEIRAADNGRVMFAGWHEHGLGYAVGIDHGNGYETWYGHMKEHPPLEVGDIVEQGEFIGPMGSTGFSTGPHVHFVIALDGQYQDPGSYLQ
jgi:murein DD-endopeptidase MepM/ murein hydrolase activator NlpD